MDPEKLKLIQSLGASTASSAQAMQKPKNKLIIPVLIFIASIIIILVVYIFWPKKPGLDSVTVHKESHIAELNKIEPSMPPAGNIVASGYIVARRQATIAAEITGKIKAVLMEEGMQVTSGQIIATLDDTLAQTELQTERAKLNAAESLVVALAAQLKEADYTTQHYVKLYADRVVSEANLVAARAKSEALKAQLEQAKSTVAAQVLFVKSREELLDKYTLRAPFAGVVIEKSAQMGEIISPQSAGGSFTRTGVATIVDMDSLEIEVEVNEANIAQIKPNMQAVARLDAYPNWAIKAHVIAIIPTASRDKATIKVRIKILEKDPRILPNMAVKVNFIK